MPIKSDCHLHSHFSGDSDTPMESMIQAGITQGLQYMCFTEHLDIDFPYKENPAELFEVNTDSYLYDLICLRKQYQNEINILFGVELGIQPHLTKELNHYVRSYDFDFVIASSHACHGKDPFYTEFYEGRSVASAYREYFESILENVKSFSHFDVYGHLDYVVRYGPTKNKDYSYAQYADIIDAILTDLVSSGKGIEINMGGFRAGLNAPNPCPDIIKRYHELGGEIITFGSDAHKPEHIAYEFGQASEIAKACGFRYYCVFEKRMPAFLAL